MRKLSLITTFIIFFHEANAQNKYYGANVISAIALHNASGPGLGLQYEFILPNRKLSILIPLAVFKTTVPKARGVSQPDEGTNLHPEMIYGWPGIRYYPTGSNGIVRYSIGSNIIIGQGRGEGSTYTNGTNNLQHRSVIGILLANGINFHPSPPLRIGVELDLGLGKDNGIDSRPILQASFNIGYRF